MSATSSVSSLWRGSPSRWMLFNMVVIWSIVAFLGSVATFSYFGIVISEQIDWLQKTQVFFAKNPLVIYGLWGLSGYTSLILLVKYTKLTFENYEITEDRLKFSVGILTRSYDETMLFRIVDSTVELPILLRILGRGHVIIYSNDPSEESGGLNASFNTPDGRKGVYLSAIKDPHKVKSILDEYVEKARQRRGVRGAEMM